MPILARFRALPDDDKASLVRKLVENSTPDFDYFFLIGLSTMMATLGLLLDSPAIVIGSMLIAPLMYPILSVGLGLVMMSNKISVLKRAFSTLVTSLGLGLGVAIVVAFIFGDGDSYLTAEILDRAYASHLHLLVAVAAGTAVAYVLARPEWSDTLPGVAIAVALIPPLAAVGVGIASLNPLVIKGAVTILILNLIGIIAAAVTVFLLMNLSEKEHIATSTIKKEDEKVETEKKIIAEVNEQIAEEEKVVIKETVVTKPNHEETT